MFLFRSSLFYFLIYFKLRQIHSLNCTSCATNKIGVTEEEIDNCFDGVNIDEVNCEAEGWGSECITRAYWHERTFTWIYFRSCSSPSPMTCEEGHMGFVDGSQMWTTCCDTDLCNDQDPLMELTDGTTEGPGTGTPDPPSDISCLSCATANPSNSEEDIANCASGENLTAVACEEEGLGSSCVARVFILASTGMEVWIRSCVAAPPVSCDPGYTDYGESGEFWTLCCDTELCNSYDPRDETTTSTETSTTTTSDPEPTDGVRCAMCTTAGGQGTDEEILNCIKGENLEDTTIDCEAEGWGSSCIARVYKQPTGEELWIRSCLAAPPMTCDAGHVVLETGAQYWTLCCEDDSCNTEDPRDQQFTTTTTTTAPVSTTTTTRPEETTEGDGSGAIQLGLSLPVMCIASTFLFVFHN